MIPRSLVDRMLYRRLLLALAGAMFTAASAVGAGGPARLVRDINMTLSPAIGSFPRDFAFLGEITLFRASTSATGLELWRTDGTEAGTVLVEDIRPGPVGALQSPLSGPDNFLITAGTTLFFMANDGVRGYGLWRSDGTEAGTSFLHDVFAGSFSTFDLRHAYAGAGGILYFVVNDPDYGHELWRSDGTEAGTFMLGDIHPGRSGALTGGTPLLMASVCDVMYFRADDGSHGPELWRTDGTVQGTSMVGDIWPGPTGSNPAGFVEQGGILLFSAFGPGAGVELWASDGTAAGTRLVKDLVPGSSGSFPQQLTGAGGSAYFRT
jgi:ELWxxDGT repeat protein